MLTTLFNFISLIFLFTTSVAGAESCSVSFDKINSSGLCNMAKVKELQESSLKSSSCDKRQLTKALSFFTSCEKMAEKTFSLCKEENVLDITQKLISYISFIKEANDHLQSKKSTHCSKDEALVNKLNPKGSLKVAALDSKGAKESLLKKKSIKKEESTLRINNKDFKQAHSQDKIKNKNTLKKIKSKNIARNLTSLIEDKALLKEALLDENISGSLFYGMTYFQKNLCRSALESGNEDGIEMACFRSINAAWFMDRDNSMSNATDNAAKALYILSSTQGRIVTTQICPGVFVTVAHGAITEDVLSYTGEALKKFLASKKGNRIRIYPFPMIKRKYLNGESINFEYFGKRLSEHSAWNEHPADYLIIKVKPSEAKKYANSKGFNYNSKHYVTPVSASLKEIQQASNSGGIDIYLYRGKTRFWWDEKAKTPVINEEGEFDERFKSGDLAKIFNVPQKVNVPCEIGGGYDYSVTNSCPSENGVSSSPYIFKKNNKFYLVGIHNSGSGERKKVFSNNHRGDTNFLRSAAFCEDYKKACGKPCVTLTSLLSI